ncbi:hypothetical protein AB3K78_09115 [Leucobacter sp. HNU]|uniref:hypothetical protein n=1 Tax=Leucobacter sp. HNU TaxID=3236805 RepID=UPI003A7FAB49
MALTEQQKAERAAKRNMKNALAAEEHAHRQEAHRQEWQEKRMYLTREQAAARELCRGCGLPIMDGLGDWPPLMQLSDEERLEHDAAEGRFKELHPDCGSHRWSISGSHTMHCGLCCPPLPIPPEYLERVRRILASANPREEELDIWERTLTCGHLVQQSVHHTNSGPSFSTQRCDECGITRGVVSSVKIVEASERKKQAERERENQIVRAEGDLAKAEKAAKEARRKLDALRSEGVDS